MLFFVVPLLVLSALGSAFSPSTSRYHHLHPSRSSSAQQRQPVSPLCLQISENDEPFRLPVIDVRMFLTQRSIQSFFSLLASMHDVHTMKWMDDYTQPICPSEEENDEEEDVDPERKKKWINVGWIDSDKELSSKLLHYHGMEAMNTTLFPTWDSYFEDLIEVPPTVLEISTPTNPLVKDSSFTIDIEPSRLCARMLSVREQIAREWADKDLGVIGSCGFDMFYSYWENVKDQTLENRTFERLSTHFMDSWDPYSDRDEVAPSPLRRDNFDLLYNLATQESIHRVLKQGISVEQDELGEASTAFLLQFYLERLDSHFRGDLVLYGKADDFIEEMMLCTPRMTTAEDGTVVIVNPVTISEVVLKMREKVAADWQEIAKNAPEEHFAIRKQMLSKMMEQ